MFKIVLRSGERKFFLRSLVECFSSQCHSGHEKSNGRNGIKRAKLCGEIPPSPRGFYCPHCRSSSGAVLVRRESLQCMCCTERHVNLYGTQNSKVETQWETQTPWAAMGGVESVRRAVAVAHTRPLVRSLSTTVCCQPVEGLQGARAARPLLLPPAPPSPGSKLQVFQGDTSFSFLKTKQLSCLIWKSAGLWAEEAGYNNALILSGL